jgi:hypothetical protein
MEEVRNVSKTVLRRHEWKKPFENPRRKWNFNIEMDRKQDMKVCIGFIWLR